MDVLAKIRERLKNYPALNILEDEYITMIETPSANGFDVWCSDKDHHLSLHFKLEKLHHIKIRLHMQYKSSYTNAMHPMLQSLFLLVLW
jgi:hypothetical protein